MHRKPTRFTIPRLHLWRGKRKYVTTFVGLLIAAGLGISSAQWVTIPNGHGNAYGHGKNASQGLALRTLDYSSNAGMTAFGPSDSGVLYVGVANDNPVIVDVTSVAPSEPSPTLTVVGNPACVAHSPADFTVTAFTGSTAIPANGQGEVQMAITTTATLPSCMAGAFFSMPVDLQGVAA